MSAFPVINPPTQTFFKVTYSFAQTSELYAGWSESIWGSASTLTAMQNIAVAFAPLRQAILGVGAILARVRISQVAAPFRTVTKQTLNLAGTLTGTSTGLTAGAPFAKGLLRVVGAGGLYTYQWLGGLPTGLIGPNGVYTPTAQWTKALTQFLGGLANGPWYVKKTTQTGASTKQIGITVAGAGVFSLPNHGFVTGNLVSMGRWPAGFGVNGIWPITRIDANTFTLVGWPVPTVLPVPTKSSYAQLYGWSFLGIPSNESLVNAAEPVTSVIRLTEHKIGRPSPAYSGRRKTRKK